jgi:hypothetical protein
MNVSFLWQDAIWVVLGFAVSRAFIWANTRLRRRRLRAFLGRDALTEPGIAVTVPVLRPLTSDNFDPNAEATIALKSDDTGQEVRRPIYGEVLHLADYQSAEQIFALLREQGARRTTLLPDADALGKWTDNPCVICLGSPFVNATLGELLTLDGTGEQIYADRTSDTLDSYRVEVHQPERLTLGVDKDHAIGVIVRLGNPAKPGDWVVGVWGDRVESTYETARYFHRNFKQIAGLAAPSLCLTALLAVRGRRLNITELMYAATDHVLMRKEDLLRSYDRSGATSRPETVGPETAG